ncbi:c-type cytochrome [Paracoccus pacificus]|uniref:C-type cytochrome n=1 Tax=Paracoccus pacificus TaxID=1463598 RepID=A0ABW4RBB9_9RHOB
MFNTMTLTKAAGALIGALLFLLLANWAAGALYLGGESEVAEGEESEQAYAIEVPDAPAAGGEAAASGPDFATVFAAADAAAGEKVFGKCKACHKIDGGDATGPHLNGVVGRQVGSIAGFAYSDAMKNHGGDWTPEALYNFLLAPKKEVPGTKMTFAGLPKPEDRANLIAWLETQK